MNKNQYYIYITTNKTNTVLYTGITSNLIKRTYEHKNKLVLSFTSKYNISKLVYYEIFDEVYEAIKREKQIKGGSRQKKIDLIKKLNPSFNDLYNNIFLTLKSEVLLLKEDVFSPQFLPNLKVGVSLRQRVKLFHEIALYSPAGESSQ